MENIKILNLYAGIGGNRLDWKNCNVTAVEYDKKIADVYSKRFPKDTIIIGDALEYLLEHYLEYDFIWVSPPCQTHSSIINSQYTRSNYKAKLPDMTLYKIILFLQGHGRKCKWVVENVKPYYTPLIEPTVIIDRHLYWSNFNIEKINISKEHIIKYVTIKDAPCDMGNISNKRQVIRNQVNHTIGLHILNEAFKGEKMPNWCNNNVEITGKDENVKKFIKDFNKKGFELGTIGTTPKEEWYEWNIKHFGTKWNIYKEDIEWLDENNCSFDTAWSPPLPFYESASEKYQIKIKASYEEYGCMYVGCFEVNCGAVDNNLSFDAFEIDNLESIECIYGDIDNYIETYEYMNIDGYEKEDDYKDRLSKFEEFKKYVRSL